MTIFGEIDWFTMWRHWWDLLTWNREYNINPYHCWPHPSTTSRQTGSEVVGHLVTPQVRQLGLVVGVKTAVFLPCQPKRLPLITALDIRQFKSSSRFPLTSMTNKPLGSRKYPPTESNRILVSMLTWIFIAKIPRSNEIATKKMKKSEIINNIHPRQLRSEEKQPGPCRQTDGSEASLSLAIRSVDSDEWWLMAGSYLQTGPRQWLGRCWCRLWVWSSRKAGGRGGACREKSGGWDQCID